MKTGIDEAELDKRLATLETVRAWSPRVMSKLESFLRTADDRELYRINPLAFGTERGIAEAEAIDLFLHASSLGLFEMDWLLVCPLCACIVESFGSLRTLEKHYRCALCRTDYEAVLDDYITITFTVCANVRRIRFHDPDALPARDYCFQCRVTLDGVTPDGKPWMDHFAAATPEVRFIQPHAVERIEIDVGEGTLLGWDFDADDGFEFTVAEDAPPAPRPLSVGYDDRSCEPATGRIAPGRIVLEIRNASARRRLFGLTVTSPGFSHPDILFRPFLTGKRLLTTQTFRTLFRSELIRASEGIGVKDITLLFTDLKSSTALYDRIGDLSAFSLVQQHFDRLRDVTVANGGTVIKTIGDAVMAAFLNPRDAVAAAVAMLDEMERFNRDHVDRPLILKIGLHKGASIAVTSNDQLDYFGQAVNIAARVQGLAQAEEIYLTRDVHDYPGVGELLEPFVVERRTAHLKGVNLEMPVFRVAGGGSLTPAARLR
ncbi:adenylate/guanylate cyclase domain-containing protein [Skermanella sp. TT6]|uniref:Adenylate/guanylate cyclase domain-containing protein n=1 Tax=Skermanella cutis TaxID=2775420 RepID=A0ABX7BAA1_9PROT|nr:adenylate/guanylate cyclase domain-containing protein [Skermanella sp. TT6]QQP91311.1 adenylate/guanylate cyclase domain-containing protein [Skermanella sp. TT6]